MGADIRGRDCALATAVGDESLLVLKMANSPGPERLVSDEELWDHAATIDDGTRIPLEVTKRIMAGESPIKVYRDWRGMTQRQLAKAAGIGNPVYLSQIETKRRKGSADMLRRIARALSVELDDVVV
jgi:DNA-binding XRE family transcriptional regulator